MLAKLKLFIDMLKAGTILQKGKYEIIKALGQGGFGITYMVKHKMLNTFVAVKEFFPEDFCYRDNSTSRVSILKTKYELVKKLRDRFISEARNIASLNHQSIVKIHDIFEENETAYYVMELVRGYTLGDVVRHNGPFSETEAVQMILKISDAIEFIHKKNMTHYDIKPDNIMIRQDNNMPVLIDFGLSKKFSEEGLPKSTFLMGISDGFSPIEQYSPSGITSFSPKSDIYALGATLYYMMTGNTPVSATKLAGRTIDVPQGLAPRIAQTIKWSMQYAADNRCPNISDFKKSIEENTNAGCFDDEAAFANFQQTQQTGKHEGRTIKIDGSSQERVTKTISTKTVLLIVTGILFVALSVIIFTFTTDSPNSDRDAEYADTQGIKINKPDEASEDNIENAHATVENTENVENAVAAAEPEGVVPAEEAGAPVKSMEQTYSKSQFKSEFNSSECEEMNIQVGDIICKMYYAAYGPYEAYAVIVLNGRVFKFKGGQDEGLTGMDQIGGAGWLVLDWNIGSGEMELGACRYNILLPTE